MIKKVLSITIFAFFLSSFIFLDSFQAQAVSKVTVKEMIVKHSLEMGIDPAIALSIAKRESGFCHERQSKHGAVGVFQLMPQTARRMGYNPYQINDNIKGGITYYKKMYKMFGSMELALAAYNAGPGNVKKYNGIPPFSETKKFVSSIMSDYHYFKTDPIVKQTQVNNTQVSNNQLSTEDKFRQEQDAVLKSFLTNQAI